MKPQQFNPCFSGQTGQISTQKASKRPVVCKIDPIQYLLAKVRHSKTTLSTFFQGHKRNDSLLHQPESFHFFPLVRQHELFPSSKTSSNSGSSGSILVFGARNRQVFDDSAVFFQNFGMVSVARKGRSSSCGHKN